MRDSPYSDGYTIDWRKPMLLDTDEKLEWANRYPLRLPAGPGNGLWKFGDHCPFKPIDLPSEK